MIEAFGFSKDAVYNIELYCNEYNTDDVMSNNDEKCIKLKKKKNEKNEETKEESLP